MLPQQQRKFTQAALAYLGYGVAYEGFAALRMWQTGLGPGLSATKAATYLAVGALIMVLVPWWVYRGHRRFTQVVAFLVGLRAVGLMAVLGGLRLPFLAGREHFFQTPTSPEATYAAALAITLVTFLFLIRAGWDLGRSGAS